MKLAFFGRNKQKENRPLNSAERRFVDEVGQFEQKFDALKPEELKVRTEEFQKEISDAVARAGKSATPAEVFKIEQGVLDKILPEAFALVRSAAKRTIGQRHYDVQLMGGQVLHQGKIAEMKTGEGKTLVASLALYLNALPGHGAHLVTVNDYLSRRDAGWMGPIFHMLGLSIATIGHETSLLFDPEVIDEAHTDERLQHFKSVSRKEAYAADITYGTNNEFGFDYLRDNMSVKLEQCAQRGLYFAIVDEVDSILIDEARTPLIISQQAEESASLYQQFAGFVPRLQKEIDYIVDEKERQVSITSEGIKKMEDFLGVSNIYEAQSVALAHHLEEALKAHALFKLDKDYVVKDGEIVIVDEFTGRLMPGRRFSEGLHQALEAKEEVEVKHESDTLATISFQNLFRLYKKLSGMTGTAKTEEEEFWKIYGLAVEVAPTNKPMIRLDLPDKIYKTEEAKWQAVAEDIKERYEKGQPVLVGTVSIEKNEYLSRLLIRRGVPHEILNAKNHEREANIIIKAGQKGAVTVATNMAGRGTDIKVEEAVLELGGLHVLGTERHEARRIDNQLRGRTGRQGDPGSSQFYVSLEDDLMRIFGGDRIKNMMTMLKVPEDMPLESNMISRALESAQKRVEGHNFDIRKHVVEYDDVMNKHRARIYVDRRRILEESNLKKQMMELIETQIGKIADAHLNVEEDAGGLKKELTALLGVLADSIEVKEDAVKYALKIYKEKEAKIGPEVMRELERVSFLRSIDVLWVEHLNAMEQMRHGIGLVGYSQREPLVEYKHRAYELFLQLLESIERSTLDILFKAQLVPQIAPVQGPITLEGPSEALAGGAVNANDLANEPVIDELSITEETSPQDGTKVSVRQRDGNKEHITATSKKVGRNDPCPCGSGKKYKKCHGKFA